MGKTVETPEAGRIYRASDGLMFVTGVTVSEHRWEVTGYKVTRGGVLTDEPVTESGQVGTFYGTDNKAFCVRGYEPDVPGHVTVHIPVFSDAHTASGAPLRLAEEKGRKLYLAAQ